MKILFSSPYVTYPPTYGGTITPYFHLRGLAGRGHDLTMVFPLRRPKDEENLSGLRDFGALVTRRCPPQGNFAIAGEALRTNSSLRVTRHRLSGMGSLLVETLRERGPFDLVYLDTVFTGYLLEAVRRESEAPVLMMEHNVESQVFERLAQNGEALLPKLVSSWEIPRMRAAEQKVYSQATRIMTFSPEDSRTIESSVPTARTVCLGPGVETFVGENLPEPPDRETVLFMASYGWPPNVDAAHWMAREVWPLVLPRVPHARLVLAGNDTAGKIRHLADPNRRISTPGFVESAVATTREATLCIAPLRAGGGIRLKIVEALANERPVVTTTVGAEGLGLTAGEHALFADDAATFARHVSDLLLDADRARVLARSGRTEVEHRFAWDRVIDRLEGIFATEIQAAGSGR